MSTTDPVRAAFDGYTFEQMRAAIDAAVAEARAVPDDYGSTDFGYTLAGINLTDGDKRLMSMLVHAFGTDHPAIDDLVALLWRRANPSPTPPAEQRDAELAAEYERGRRAGITQVYDSQPTPPARVALSDEQISLIGRRALDKCFGTDAQHTYIVREVERHFGITPAQGNGGKG